MLRFRIVATVALAAASFVVPQGCAQESKLQLQTHSIKYTCPKTGRFIAFPMYMTEKQYCFDGVYYHQSNVPRSVVAYFAALKRASVEREKNLHDEIEATFAKAKAESAALAIQHQAIRQEMERKFGPLGSRHSSGTRSLSAIGPRSSAGPVAASTKPEPVPVPVAVLRQITVGEEKAQVLAKLNEPHSLITGLDDSNEETWTYVAEGGAFAKIVLQANKVVAVRIP